MSTLKETWLTPVRLISSRIRVNYQALHPNLLFEYISSLHWWRKFGFRMAKGIVFAYEGTEEMSFAYFVRFCAFSPVPGKVGWPFFRFIGDSMVNV